MVRDMMFATTQRSVCKRTMVPVPQSLQLCLGCGLFPNMNKIPFIAFQCFALSVLLLGFTGCRKKQPATPPPYEINGVKVDVPRLQDAFAGAPPEIQADVNQTTLNLRYGMYEKSLMALDRLINNPALNETQKKVVNDLIEQMKQLIAKGGPPRR